MAYFVIGGIIVLAIFSVWYTKKVDKATALRHLKKKPENLEDDSDEDSPVGFGYKCMWIAVKTNNQQQLADALGLRDQQTCRWKTGIEQAYKGSIFITPTIDHWTLAAGWGLPRGDSKESLVKIKNVLDQLSNKFDEAQFFGSHRGVGYSCWAKSTKGKMDRVYACFDESDPNIEIFGEKTDIEMEYDLMEASLQEINYIDDFGAEKWFFPDEELVMTIASHWSVDPTKLGDRTDIQGPGILGSKMEME